MSQLQREAVRSRWPISVMDKSPAGGCVGEAEEPPPVCLTVVPALSLGWHFRVVQLSVAVARRKRAIDGTGSAGAFVGPADSCPSERPFLVFTRVPQQCGIWPLAQASQAVKKGHERGAVAHGRCPARGACANGEGAGYPATRGGEPVMSSRSPLTVAGILRGSFLRVPLALGAAVALTAAGGGSARAGHAVTSTASWKIVKTVSGKNFPHFTAVTATRRSSGPLPGGFTAHAGPGPRFQARLASRSSPPPPPLLVTSGPS